MQNKSDAKIFLLMLKKSASLAGLQTNVFVTVV